ncbi:lipopolysaccharide biosynthesis protein [Arthrobacter sp. PAMC25284]|uniref:lipopolysaccharide biosynthesis protein n=1 Tax=Arthrobacter sp. PAMC25284 TaxID=2861279 RepID=UPI001C62A062|nr:lipopolysaccharide biosynthesis protein [Arthrobacter sp. PAMC25284]QYF90892.1 lipopolysaccharide biosynthesis protein [Arthrobacter sp. PAMC25284]
MTGTAASRSAPGARAAGHGEQNSGQMPTTARSVRWSFGAVLARQGFQLASAVVLARILGPESYGVIAAATVYISLVALLLDQGLSAALIQHPDVDRRMAGATATLNLVVATVLGALTWWASPSIAGFFRVDELEPILRLLAFAIPLKALAITPRAMLSREMQLHRVGAADIVAAAIGSAAGISAALAGSGPWAMVYQVVATDLVYSCLLLRASRGPLPNLAFRSIVPLFRFSISVFATDCLAYVSRNMDNILVGRVLGVGALSLYGMAYRILVVPVQLIGQTVNRVMFPAFARSADRPHEVAAQLLTATRLLAIAAIPLMTFVACTAPELVNLVLGTAWLPAAALVSVLAIGGARETVFYVTPSLMKGLGKGALIVRYEILAALIQVGGIVIGLQFGVLGVAIGYSAAGFVLTPLLLWIQQRLTGVTTKSQLAAILPAVHAALWGAAGYWLWSLVDLPSLWRLLGGLPVFFGPVVAVLFVFHRAVLSGVLAQTRALFRRPPSQPQVTSSEGP